MDGYIHNWLVAGPQAIEVQGVGRFSGPQYKLQIARRDYESKMGILGKPNEYGDCQCGEFKGKGSYVRTRRDHLVDLPAFTTIPTLRAWAYTEIDSPCEQELTCILPTHGPADLWIISRHVHRQEHYYHQILNRVRFQACPSEGVSRLRVRFEEAAARKRSYGCALQLCGFQSQADADDQVARIPAGAPDALRRLKMELLLRPAASARMGMHTSIDYELVRPFWRQGIMAEA